MLRLLEFPARRFNEAAAGFVERRRTPAQDQPYSSGEEAREKGGGRSGRSAPSCGGLSNCRNPW